MALKSEKEKREKHSPISSLVRSVSVFAWDAKVCIKLTSFWKPWVSLILYTFNILSSILIPHLHRLRNVQMFNYSSYAFHFKHTRLFVSIQIYVPVSHKTYRLFFSTEFLKFPQHFFIAFTLDMFALHNFQMGRLLLKSFSTENHFQMATNYIKHRMNLLLLRLRFLQPKNFKSTKSKMLYTHSYHLLTVKTGYWIYSFDSSYVTRSICKPYNIRDVYTY